MSVTAIATKLTKGYCHTPINKSFLVISQDTDKIQSLLVASAFIFARVIDQSKGLCQSQEIVIRYSQPSPAPRFRRQGFLSTNQSLLSRGHDLPAWTSRPLRILTFRLQLTTLDVGGGESIFRGLLCKQVVCLLHLSQSISIDIYRRASKEEREIEG